MIDGRRPDGASLVPLFRGKCIAWDFTCVHPTCVRRPTSLLQPTLVPSSLTPPKTKRNRYQDIEVTYIFEPVAYETLGGIGTTSCQFLKEISHRISSHSRDWNYNTGITIFASENWNSHTAWQRLIGPKKYSVPHAKHKNWGDHKLRQS